MFKKLFKGIASFLSNGGKNEVVAASAAAQEAAALEAEALEMLRSRNIVTERPTFVDPKLIDGYRTNRPKAPIAKVERPPVEELQGPATRLQILDPKKFARITPRDALRHRSELLDAELFNNASAPKVGEVGSPAAAAPSIPIPEVPQTTDKAKGAVDKLTDQAAPGKSGGIWL